MKKTFGTYSKSASYSYTNIELKVLLYNLCN